MEIAKAVVLASSCLDSAPWPSVGVAARQLAPVANRPVLFHHLDALAKAGVRQAAILTDGATRTSIREAVGDGSEWGLEFTHLELGEFPNVLASAAVADFVGTDPVLIHHSDVLMRERLGALSDDFVDRDLDALILRPAAPPGHTGSSAGYIIMPRVFPALHQDTSSLDDALQRMRATGARIGIRDVDACMPCHGGAEQLLEANRRMLEQLPLAAQGERVFDSQIQGTVAIHPSAEIRDSLIRGPVAIGPGANITNAYVGPYTSIGAGAELDCVEIEHSIVLDRAQVRFVPVRIEGSLIGPGASVSRDFELPRAMRLFVGEGARVSLAV